jgi:adenylate cyclase
MGSARRLSYSLIGDTVNLASRIEGLSKPYGVRILMGEELARQHLAHQDNAFAIVEVDRVPVVVREKPATVFALLGDEVLAGSPDFAAFARRHAKLLDDYRNRAWDEAERALDENLEEATKLGLAKLYARYRASIAACRENPPPEGWDGVTVAESK